MYCNQKQMRSTMPESKREKFCVDFPQEQDSKNMAIHIIENDLFHCAHYKLMNYNYKSLGKYFKFKHFECLLFSIQ